MKHTFRQEAKCPLCKGTGIYVGIGEKDGAGIVCHDCKGTGKKEIVMEWENFEGKQIRQDIKRVYECNPGICVNASSEFGGMPYENWLIGEPFPLGSENRKYICPAWWYQSVKNELRPHWGECIGCGSFSNCPSFAQKEKCWQRWDKEFSWKGGK